MTKDIQKINLRIPYKMHKRLKEAAADEGISINALITYAIEKYFLKEIIPDELILAKCGVMHQEIEKLMKVADMSGRIFIEFMVFFFLMHPINPLETDQDTFQLKLNQANRDADVFLEIFRRHIKSGCPEFLEQILASIYESEVTE